MGYRRLNPLEKLINKLFSKKSMISEELLESKIRSFSKPTVSYFMLLTASVVIATLGLLMNASAIVIGSMIISPLTWPMFGLADGAALGNRKRIRANLAILLASILLGALLAYALTILSPLKVVNEEIIARSQPTLLDAVVALTAGAIGALAIVRRNISDSVAGVAVALSLTPPLCVIGISLALNETEIVKGSFLLMVTNALSITLVAGILFIAVHYSWRRKLRMAPKAFAVMVVSLLITAIPLYRLLNDYSLEASSYAVVQRKLEGFVTSTASSSSVQNIRTNLEEIEGQDVLVIEADVYLPPSVVITFQEKELLVSDLEAELGRLIDLRLRLQNVSLLANANDLEQRIVVSEIDKLVSSEFRADSLDVTLNDVLVNTKSNPWEVSVQLTGYQDKVPTKEQVAEIKTRLQDSINQPIDLSIQFLPLVQIRSGDSTNLTQLQDKITAAVEKVLPFGYIDQVRIKEGQDTADIKLLIPEGTEIDDELRANISNVVNDVADKQFAVRLSTQEFVEVTAN